MRADTQLQPTGVDLIAAERKRQVSGEGWTPDHDDTHVRGEMALAGAVYAWPDPRPPEVKKAWPWDRKWFRLTMPDREPVKCSCRSVVECMHLGTVTPDAKRSARIRDLAKAGALIAAEIDRLQRAHPSPSEPST